MCRCVLGARPLWKRTEMIWNVLFNAIQLSISGNHAFDLSNNSLENFLKWEFNYSYSFQKQINLKGLKYNLYVFVLPVHMEGVCFFYSAMNWKGLKTFLLTAWFKRIPGITYFEPDFQFYYQARN